jgi:hypothetical protein
MRKHSAPMKVPKLATRASSVTPVLLMKAPTAEAPKAIEPSMLIQAASHSRDFSRTIPTVRVTATTPSAPLTRNATEPAASGHQTKCRRAGIRCAHNAAPVLTLKRRVPTNCVAADRNSTRIERVSHGRLIDGLLSSSWISAALVKNQEPMKHSRLVAPAPASVPNPGAVPIAKKDDPIANNQHWRRSISVFSEVSITCESYEVRRHRVAEPRCAIMTMR